LKWYNELGKLLVVSIVHRHIFLNHILKKLLHIQNCASNKAYIGEKKILKIKVTVGIKIVGSNIEILNFRQKK